jgi:hypothetical protein
MPYSKLKVLLLCSSPLFEVLSHLMEVRHVTVVDSLNEKPHAILSDTKSTLNILHGVGNTEFFYVSNATSFPVPSWEVTAVGPHDHIGRLDLSELEPQVDQMLAGLRIT